MIQPWWYFWTACFAIAGICFTLIAMIVLVRGVGDLRKMLLYLATRHK